MVFFIALKALLDKASSIFTWVKTSEAQMSSRELGLATVMVSPVVISNTACARASFLFVSGILLLINVEQSRPDCASDDVRQKSRHAA